jgi:hypothetical protein
MGRKIRELHEFFTAKAEEAVRYDDSKTAAAFFYAASELVKRWPGYF